MIIESSFLSLFVNICLANAPLLTLTSQLKNLGKTNKMSYMYIPIKMPALVEFPKMNFYNLSFQLKICTIRTSDQTL